MKLLLMSILREMALVYKYFLRKIRSIVVLSSSNAFLDLLLWFKMRRRKIASLPGNSFPFRQDVKQSILHPCEQLHWHNSNVSGSCKCWGGKRYSESSTCNVRATFIRPLLNVTLLRCRAFIGMVSVSCLKAQLFDNYMAQCSKLATLLDIQWTCAWL